MQSCRSKRTKEKLQIAEQEKGRAQEQHALLGSQEYEN